MFNNFERFFVEILDFDFDLLILDIEMSGIDGLYLVEMLQDKLIIFCIVYKEYVVDVFNIDVVDYIIKLVKLECL